MLNFNHILQAAGFRYKLMEFEKLGNEIAPEIQSDQVRALAFVMVEELNKELNKINHRIDNLNKELDKIHCSVRDLCDDIKMIKRNIDRPIQG